MMNSYVLRASWQHLRLILDNSLREREESKINFRFQVICCLNGMRKAGKRASLEVKSIFQYFFPMLRLRCQVFSQIYFKVHLEFREVGTGDPVLRVTGTKKLFTVMGLNEIIWKYLEKEKGDLYRILNPSEDNIPQRRPGRRAVEVRTTPMKCQRKTAFRKESCSRHISRRW